jgi:hypothetical protein
MSGGTQMNRLDNITEHIHKELPRKLPRKPLYPTLIENTKKKMSETIQNKQCVGLHVFDPNQNNPAVDNKLNDFHNALNKRMDQYYYTSVCEGSLILT